MSLGKNALVDTLTCLTYITAARNWLRRPATDDLVILAAAVTIAGLARESPEELISTLVDAMHNPTRPTDQEMISNFRRLVEIACGERDRLLEGGLEQLMLHYKAERRSDSASIEA